MTKLKCWKKTDSPNWVNGIKYIEKGNEIITKYGFPPRPRTHILIQSPEQRSIVTKKYSVDVTQDRGRSIIDKEFKTKPQALKFANKYMKNHDKC